MAVVALGWLGCATGPKLTVTDTELLKVRGEPLAPVEEGRAQVRLAEEAVAVAKKAEGAASRKVKIADLRVDRADLDVEIAKLKFDAAEETRDAEALLPARTEREKALEAKKVADAELPFRKAELRHREAEREEAEAGLAEARAELELAKLEAVLSVTPDVGLEGEKRRADFKAQLASAKSRRAEAKQNVSGVALEVEAAQKRYEAVRPSRGKQGETVSAPAAVTPAEVVRPGVP